MPFLKNSPLAPFGPSVVLIEGIPFSGSALVLQKSTPVRREILKVSVISLCLLQGSESASASARPSLKFEALKMSKQTKHIRNGRGGFGLAKTRDNTIHVGVLPKEQRHAPECQIHCHLPSIQPPDQYTPLASIEAKERYEDFQVMNGIRRCYRSQLGRLRLI